MILDIGAVILDITCVFIGLAVGQWLGIQIAGRRINAFLAKHPPLAALLVAAAKQDAPDEERKP